MLTRRPLTAVHRVLALTLCVGLGLLLAVPGTAWGIGGYASGQTAVAAQYPDSTAAQSGAPAHAVSDLAQVMAAIRRAETTAGWQASHRALVRREVQALASGAGLDMGQTGSIAVLIAGGAVIFVGALLRWRRGHAPTE